MDVGEVVSGNAVRNQEVAAGNSLLAKLQNFAAKYGMEQRGIEWVPEDKREDTSVFRMGTMWFSCNMAVTSFVMGAVAVPVFGLGFVDSVLVILLFNIVGALPVALFSAFGAKFGLRQMVLSRFFFGYYMAKPRWAGVLLVILLTFLVGLFGYRIVHAYERWAWLPCMAVLVIVLGVFAHSGRFDDLLPLSTGSAEASSVLSYSTAIYGYMAGWCSFAADYSVYQPSIRPARSIFVWSFAGLYTSTVFCELLGAAVATAIVGDEDYLGACSDSGVGGLLSAVLSPVLGRFGDVCIVVLALSIIATTCPVVYSVSFSLQALSKSTQRVPRFLWTAVGVCVCVAIAVPAYDGFSSWLENLVLVTGYWTSLYIGILIPEHFVFRRSFSAYNLGDYVSPEKLPPGAGTRVR
ncbi:hypothetical protein NEMBOFW57_003213 [Staphylotrichum longicolle]|uniref:Purine-cytosine permease n=1 Tax=Staphylotrichum longicolle TaxID=669026 RepID=A0AAD4F7F5_9PEZI|nr:hypothetical protein NEMBOFW57_003213 [Staphylotrichum longicolle]